MVALITIIVVALIVIITLARTIRVVPQAQAESLAFHWRVYLAPGLQPSGLSLGLHFDEPLPTISWAEYP